MRESKPHGFVAWLFDFYVTSFFVGGVEALVIAITGTNGSLALALGFFGSVILAVSIYHLAVARHVGFLTPGEKIAGRFTEGGRKIWRNPYRLSRWPLFTCMLLVAILAGNTWDGIGAGATYTVMEVGFLLGILALLSISFVAVGRGNAWGMAGVALYPALMTVISAIKESDVPGVKMGLVTFFGVVTLTAISLGAVYSRAGFVRRGTTA